MSAEKKFYLVYNFWFALFLSAVMSFALPLMNGGQVTFKGFLIGVLQGAVVANLVGILIPVPRVTAAFMRLFPLKEGNFAYVLVSNIPATVIFVLVMSFAMTLFAIGPVPGWIKAGILTIPQAGVVAYPISIIIAPLVVWLTKCLVKPE